MQLKKLIGLLLVFVMALQVLPVKQVGCLLSSNQLQEEMPHEDINKPDAKDFGKTIFLHDHYLDHSLEANLSSPSFFIYDAALPPHISEDILTPPPNLL
ncbi:MAG: hypothetical protein JWN76_1707 [Chitinophagaceae bacterium]|nr:hypothetical protein [Chitinophagaceae bacterium]